MGSKLQARKLDLDGLGVINGTNHLGVAVIARDSVIMIYALHGTSMQAGALTAMKDMKNRLLTRYVPVHKALMKGTPAGPSHSACVSDP